MEHSGADQAIAVPRPKLGNRRVTGKEQYYTAPELAKRLTATMVSVIGADAVNRTWIEPAGGTGAFVNALHDAGVWQVISYDIEPFHPLVQRGDFLAAPLTGSGFAAISNPPFGRANSLNIPFFNKLAPHCDYIGFIVPKSWRKWSITDRLNRNFHVIHDEELVVNYVDATGLPLAAGKTNLNTVFQIWERRADLRPKVTVEDRGYIRKTTPELADVSLTIFGFGCGTVKTEFERRPNTTQMFLQVHDDGVIDALHAADLAQFYTQVAYTPALGIKEIRFALNQYFDSRRQSTIN